MTEELDPILIQITIPIPIAMIYPSLVEPARLDEWLTRSGQLEPKVGGRVRLHIEGEETFDSVGEVTHLTPDVDVGFTWTGPSRFAPLFQPPHRSSVYIRLQESPEGIDVTLEHTGWPATDAGESARSWHFHFWAERLGQLKERLLKAAYG